MDAAPFSRRKSEASRLVGSFQELNDRLSAFERLNQLKQMVIEGKLKQDVFEEMYRINAEKLVDSRGRKSSKKFEISGMKVLEDFSVKHRTQGPTSLIDLTAVVQAKTKRGSLFFDRIVLRSASAFGSTKETILIGTQELTLIFYDDEPRRVDLSFESKRQEQFMFETEVEKLMFVEALERALDTAARASTSKDEPVLLGRPSRTNSQMKKELDARKSACLILEQQAALPSTTISQDSFRSTSSFETDVKDFDEEEEEELMRAAGTSDPETEEKEEDEQASRPASPERNVSPNVTTITSPSLSESSKHTTLSNLSPSSGESISTRSASSNSFDMPSLADTERVQLLERLEDARRERTIAEKSLEEKKAMVLECRRLEEEEQKALHRTKAAEDEAVKAAIQSREEDVVAAKNLSDCVAAEIAALNALDPDDILSSTTNRTGDDSENNTNLYMSPHLRNLIGQSVDPSVQMNPYARMQYNLQQARKALAAARQKVEKTSEKRRVMEAARRDARKVVSAQITKCSEAMRAITRAENAVLDAKAALTHRDERVGHFEQCLLIVDEHRKIRTPHVRPAVSFVEIGIPPEEKEAWILTSIIT